MSGSGALGIDVGDSTSCVALARKGGVDLLLNKESKRETPSVVTFSSKRRQIGTDAVGAQSTNPRNTVSQLKRLMGKKFSDPVVQADLGYFPYRVVEGPDGGCLFEVQYLDKTTLLTAEQLMASLLVDLKATAEKEQGGPVSDAVLAVPVYYTEPERHAMLAAAQIAGLNCLRLMNDTAAVALAFGIYKTDLPEDTPINVAFVDVGFASTQVCVVALKKGQLQVLSNAWDRDLGGRDFDNVLFDHFAKEFGEKYKIDILSNNRASYRLRLACEKTKKVLTTNPEAPINIECLMNDLDVHSMMTREIFEEAAKPILDRLLQPIQRAVEQAGLTPDQLASVEVVGGTSRMPAVAAIIRDYFGKEPSRSLNAKETVARGCALQCAMLSPAFKVRDFAVQDSFPYGVQFSWAKDDGVVTSTVFERGSSVPSAKMLTFYRTEPFTISAEYTPDSDIPPTADRSIGSWSIDSFTVPAGADKAKLKVKVSLNLNGTVGVDSVTLVEEEEYEEDTPVPQAAPAVATPAGEDQPMADASAEGEAVPAAAAEGGDTATPAPMEAEAVPAAPATQKVLKRRVKKHSVPFTATTAALSSSRLQELYAAECEMALQERKQEEINDAKNALEAYIYSLRSRLAESLAAFIEEGPRSELMGKLDDMENWLYEDGEDAAKSVYTAKLAELQAQGNPIELRAEEESGRPGAAASLRSTARRLLNDATSEAAKYAHIGGTDRQKVIDAAQGALNWLEAQEAAQKQRAKTLDPVLRVGDIVAHEVSLRKEAEPILNKPPPPPPKPAAPEPAPAAEPEQMDTEAEVGPQPAADEAQQMEEGA